MKKLNWVIASTLTLSLLSITGVALSSSDKSDSTLFSWFKKTKAGIDPVESKLYIKECGSCHFPYQPGLLPATSWETITNNLDDHFGENAELSESDLNTLRNFLLNNAAGRNNYGLPNKIMASQGNRPLPLRITEMRYFVHEHSEIPQRLVQDNPKVKSFSNCDSCHQNAKSGLYDEHDVNISGYGRWDD